MIHFFCFTTRFYLFLFPKTNEICQSRFRESIEGFVCLASANEKNQSISHICPPFDAITPDLQKSLHERSDYNIVRLELARRNQDIDHYKNAANTLNDWINNGILKYDSDPAIYVTKEEFEYRGVKQVRRGFISNVKIEEYRKKIILPHEKTRLEWVEDRAQLMSESRSNFSPLLVIYKDDKFLCSTYDGGIWQIDSSGAAPSNLVEGNIRGKAKISLVEAAIR